MSLVVRLAGPRDLPALHALRHAVFVRGQGVPLELERDEHDAHCDHAVALLGGDVVGTGRLLAPHSAPAPRDPALSAPAHSTSAHRDPALSDPALVGPARIGRMAVADALRRRGVGSAVLTRLEERALERGWPAVELHAQAHARAFYELAGYLPVGQAYLEAGIEHLTMRKALAVA